MEEAQLPVYQSDRDLREPQANCPRSAREAGALVETPDVSHY